MNKYGILAAYLYNDLNYSHKAKPPITIKERKSRPSRNVMAAFYSNGTDGDNIASKRGESNGSDWSTKRSSST